MQLKIDLKSYFLANFVIFMIVILISRAPLETSYDAKLALLDK